MFLALRELWFARNRFLLMGAVVALISILMVILSGLSSGLVNDGVSALQRTPIQAFAFAPDTKADSAFSRSVVTEEQAQAWRMQPDVQDAELFGNMIVNAKTRSGTPVDLTLFGIEPGSFLEPVTADGRGLQADTDIVVSSTFRDDGVAIGDTVILDRLGTELTVVGFTEDKRTFGHVDVAYLPCVPGRRFTPVPRSAKPPTPVRIPTRVLSRFAGWTIHCRTSCRAMRRRERPQRRSRNLSTPHRASPRK